MSDRRYVAFVTRRPEGMAPGPVELAAGTKNHVMRELFMLDLATLQRAPGSDPWDGAIVTLRDGREVRILETVESEMERGDLSRQLRDSIRLAKMWRHHAF